MNLPAELSCFDISKNLFLNKNLRAYLAPNYSVMFKELYELCDMTHEKIADVLPVSGASSVTEWARGGIPNYDRARRNQGPFPQLAEISINKFKISFLL